MEFAIAAINADIDFAEKAMIEGDTIGMLQAYKALKGCQ